MGHDRAGVHSTESFLLQEEKATDFQGKSLVGNKAAAAISDAKCQTPVPGVRKLGADSAAAKWDDLMILKSY